jgi:hypothetical protein
MSRRGSVYILTMYVWDLMGMSRTSLSMMMISLSITSWMVVMSAETDYSYALYISK